MTTNTDQIILEKEIEHSNVFTVQINYKSGIQQVFECVEFSYTHGKNIEWTIAPGSKVKPLFINIDAIESVWILDTREVE